MTVNSEAANVFYIGNGATTVFAYAFNIPGVGFSRVSRTVIATQVETVLVEGVGYTISGLANPAGGNVTLTGAAMPATEVLEIRRDMSLTQLTELAGQANYSPEAVEDALDKLTMLCQQLQLMIASANLTNVRLVSYSVASLPSARNGASSLIYVRDASGGGVPCYSDGVNWRRVDTAAVVS